MKCILQLKFLEHEFVGVTIVLLLASLDYTMFRCDALLLYYEPKTTKKSRK